MSAAFVAGSIRAVPQHWTNARASLFHAGVLPTHLPLHHRRFAWRSPRRRVTGSKRLAQGVALGAPGQMGSLPKFLKRSRSARRPVLIERAAEKPHINRYNIGARGRLTRPGSRLEDSVRRELALPRCSKHEQATCAATHRRHLGGTGVGHWIGTGWNEPATFSVASCNGGIHAPGQVIVGFNLLFKRHGWYGPTWVTRRGNWPEGWWRSAGRSPPLLRRWKRKPQGWPAASSSGARRHWEQFKVKLAAIDVWHHTALAG